MVRELLRKLPYRWRHWFRYSELGYHLRAEKWMP